MIAKQIRRNKVAQGDQNISDMAELNRQLFLSSIWQNVCSFSSCQHEC